jgi:uncharacterized LabA/DUF88 family protein
MQTSRLPRLAVLIDAENTSATHAPLVMARAAEFGKPTDCRAYGDWTTPQLTPWKKLLVPLGIRPQQHFRYVKGKNTSDTALIMDAMELTLTRAVDGLCIVSSDSDYIGLALRVRAAGLAVFGLGLRSALREFVAACDDFVFLDAPVAQPA